MSLLGRENAGLPSGAIPPEQIYIVSVIQIDDALVIGAGAIPSQRTAGNSRCAAKGLARQILHGP